MHIIFLFSLILLGLFVTGIVCKTHDITVIDTVEWMSKEYSLSLKGIGIITVLWAHVGGLFGDYPIQFIAGMGVSLFLICSGYGLEASFSQNGIRHFWENRLLRVWFPFFICHSVGVAVRFLMNGEFSTLNYLKVLSFISADWYLKYILVFYFLFYLIKRVFLKYETMAWTISIVVLYLTYSTFVKYPDAPFLEARQVLCFSIGIILYKKKEIVSNISPRRCLAISVFLFLIGILFMALTRIQFVRNLPLLLSNLFTLPTCMAFALSVILFGLRFPKILSNRFLNWTGIYSYEMYLIQHECLEIVNSKVYSLFFFIVLIVIGALSAKYVTDKINIFINHEYKRND